MPSTAATGHSSILGALQRSAQTLLSSRRSNPSQCKKSAHMDGVRSWRLDQPHKHHHSLPPTEYSGVCPAEYKSKWELAQQLALDLADKLEERWTCR